ncbi:Eukaryotic translation initiation factor 3 subunit M, partial [Nowakowskiella sp. JEL0078]
MGKHQRQQIVTSSPESSAPKKENIEDIVLAEKIQPSTAKAFYNATQVIQLAKVIAAISLGIDLTLLEIPDVTEAEGEAEVVEQTEEDIELAKIRDEAQAKVNADPLVVSALNILDDESEKNAQDIEELNIKLTKESYRLLSVADKELEPVYNLVIALLKDVSPQKIPALVNSIVDPIIANSNDRPQLKLKILSNLYNSLPFNSENRYVVYTQIVNLATKSDEFELVIPTFAYLDAWIKEWKIDISSIRNIYDLISNCLSQKS